LVKLLIGTSGNKLIKRGTSVPLAGGRGPLINYLVPVKRSLRARDERSLAFPARREGVGAPPPVLLNPICSLGSGAEPLPWSNIKLVPVTIKDKEGGGPPSSQRWGSPPSI
jgi:hypothetical protein